MAELKLQALDASDLAVLSAHCQDAIVRVADLAYIGREKRFVLLCNRFDWELAAQVQPGSPLQRRRAALRFERVTRARFAGFDGAAGDAVLVLLAVIFTPSGEPAGEIRLQFAAGAEIRLDVECIEAELKDLGAVWATGSKPDHSGAGSHPARQGLKDRA